MMRTLLALGLVFGLGGFVSADDKKDDKKKADPTGTWKWEMEVMGNKRAATLKLKVDGDKVSGVMLNAEGEEAKLEDAKYKDGDLTYSVTRERDGNKFTIKYKAKIDGEKIKGSASVEFGGEERKFEFEGKKEKADK